MHEFPGLNMIYIGGNWNGYTQEAKAEGLITKVGIYVTGEMGGGIWNNEYWNYHQKDDEGVPSYFYKSQ